MAFPRKLLAPGEEVVLEAHPNWSILVPRVSLFLLVVAGCVTLAVVWGGAPAWFGDVLAAIAGVFLLWLLAKLVVWRSTTLVITNMRVVYRTGALRRLGREIPLDRVQDVTYTQSIFERMVGAGSLRIQSAGAGGDEPFPDIRRPALVQSLINRLISQMPPGGYSAGSGVSGHRSYTAPGPAVYPPPGTAPFAPPGTAPAYPPPSQPPPPAQSPSSARPHAEAPNTDEMQAVRVPSTSEELARLGELLRMGVITEREYDMKRQELLEGR
jgi:membrane protein YdbS with pleckstrin-like domain